MDDNKDLPKQNIFDRWDTAIRKGEASFVNFISSIAPWGAPLPAAYMSWEHMTRVLDFPDWLAFIVAGVIEILGFSTVSTILSFWMHNRKYTDGKKQTPIWTVLFSFAFYLFIVVTMNVVLDAMAGTENERWAVIFVKALLTLMTIPAAIILGVRTQHQEILTSIEDTKEARMVKEYFKNTYGDDWELYYIQWATGKSLGSLGSQRTARTKEHTEKYKEVYNYIQTYWEQSGSLPSLDDIMKATEVVKSYASRIRSEFKKEKGIE